MTAIPKPTVTVAGTDGSISVPWYQYFKSAEDEWRVDVTEITSGTTTNTLIRNRGFTKVNTTPATTNTLEDPVPGCRKVLVVASASTTGRIACASTTTQILPGTGWALTFATSAANKLVELVGVSTSQYYIVSNPGLATVTT